jgi:signal transduction histidine kinase
MTDMAQRLIELANQTQQRVRDRPVMLDIAFALLVFFVEIVALVGPSEERAGSLEPDIVALLFVALGALSLVWRRQRPIEVLIFLGVLLVGFYLRDYGSFMSIVGLTALYAAAAHSVNRRRAWITIVIFIVGLFGTATFSLLDRPSGFDVSGGAAMLSSIGVAVFVGVVARNREQIFVKAEARADEAEADRAAAAERARTEERLRIARELHDVVAHGMSVISVQAAAAQEIAPTDPDRAIELMRTVETTSRESLNEMRRMLGVLRNGQASPDGDQASRGPQPSLADIEATITHCRDAGLETEFGVSGEERPLSPGLELTVYRIVQEALTNALKHGGPAATASVEVGYRDTTLLVRISDTGRGVVASLSGTSSGNGLVGMRERVELYDGTLSAGPNPGGGYIVTAVIPLDSQMRRPRVVSAEQAKTEHSP